MIEMIKKIILIPRYNRIKQEIEKNPNAIILVGTSTFNNLGDHLLAYKSMEFLREFNSAEKVIEIPTQIFKRFEKKLKSVEMNNPVIISAGGWMGNLWPEDEYMMQRMLNVFKHQRIVIFPQTIYYDTGMKNYDEVINSANNTYKQCRNLTLFVRENNSFCIAKNLLNIERVYKFPDMALYKVKQTNRERSKRILTCLRDDRENISDTNIKNYIKDLAKKMGYLYGEFNTVTGKAISISRREKELHSLFEIISRGDIVITNRLHGMLSAVLCGCKCIAIDNKTNKVSGVYYSWLSNNPRVILHESTNANFEHEISILEEKDCSIDEWIRFVDNKFDEMKEVLKGAIYE